MTPTMFDVGYYAIAFGLFITLSGCFCGFMAIRAKKKAAQAQDPRGCLTNHGHVQP